MGVKKCTSLCKHCLFLQTCSSTYTVTHTMSICQYKRTVLQICSRLPPTLNPTTYCPSSSNNKLLQVHPKLENKCGILYTVMKARIRVSCLVTLLCPHTFCTVDTQLSSSELPVLCCLQSSCTYVLFHSPQLFPTGWPVLLPHPL